jgi:hypothetical protein
MSITSYKMKIDVEELNVKDFLLQPSAYYQVVPNPNTKTGRPVFDGRSENEVVAKLQYAFSIGATSKEACCFADISTDSFYRYCNKYPEFRNKIELLQTTPVFLARVAIYNAIVNGDLKMSRWYLERKRPEEFSVNGAMKYQLQQKTQKIEYLENLLRSKGIDFT